MVVLTGWRYAAFIGVIVSTIGAGLYAVAIHPMLHTEDYRKIQSKNRAGIKQEDIQPGGMKVWSDPFDRKQK